MNIEELLKQARSIWGEHRLTLDEILIRQGVTIGDLHRIARDNDEGKGLDETDLKKELGNVIFSTIRWCDDLGYTPEECLKLAIEAQSSYAKKLN